MTMARITGWRFGAIGASVERADEGVGISVTPAGGVAMVSDEAAVRQSIIMLLSTRPGERVMRPDYGCPLHRLVFNPNDRTTAGLAIHYVRQALLKWVPRIEILRLDAGSAESGFAPAVDDDSTRLYLRLNYRVRSTQQRGEVAMAIDLAGGPG
jgi:phage baseplate assembly protein W